MELTLKPVAGTSWLIFCRRARRSLHIYDLSSSSNRSDLRGDVTSLGIMLSLAAEITESSMASRMTPLDPNATTMTAVMTMADNGCMTYEVNRVRVWKCFYHETHNVTLRQRRSIRCHSSLAVRLELLRRPSMHCTGWSKKEIPNWVINRVYQIVLKPADGAKFFRQIWVTQNYDNSS